MYEDVKNLLKEAGEVMITVADGKKFELHLHNVTFDDTNKRIKIEGANETYWIDGNQIVYYWIHKAVSE